MIRTYVQKNPILSFIILNYLISWLFLYPSYQLILDAEEGDFPLISLFGLIGAYGPSIAAIIIERITKGRQGVKSLLKKLIVWRVHFIWYLIVFLLPVALYAIAIWSTRIFGFQLGHSQLKEGLISFFPFILLALPFGPMGEELGWRGFFLPKLLEKYNLWKSSLILGLVWSVWHLASFTFPGAAIPSIFEVNIWTLLLYFASITAESFLFTWIFIKTKGSVLLAILLHAVFNASSNVMLAIYPQIEENVDHRIVLYAMNMILVLTTSIILLFFRKNSSNSNLV